MQVPTSAYKEMRFKPPIKERKTFDSLANPDSVIFLYTHVVSMQCCASLCTHHARCAAFTFARVGETDHTCIGLSEVGTTEGLYMSEVGDKLAVPVVVPDEYIRSSGIFNAVRTQWRPSELWFQPRDPPESS